MPAVLEWFARGGILMFPLLVFSMLTLWIFLERLYHMKRANANVQLLFQEVNILLARKEWEKAALKAHSYPGPVAAVFHTLLLQPWSEKSELEEVAAIEGRRELQRLSIRLSLLNLIAGLTPLVGLLGTVMGMVKAFHKVGSSTQGVVNPALLANGIWEALLTTVAGLMVAIPALIFHYYLEQRVKKYAFQMDHYGSLLIRLLTTQERIHA